MAASHKKVYSKFKEDEQGFYNSRLENEATKRNKYVESRKNNMEGNNQYTKKRSYDQIMTSHMENEDEDVNNIEIGGYRGKEKFKKPTMQELTDFIKEKGYVVNTNTFFNHYESNGWMVGKNKMKSWQAAVANWNSRDKAEKQTKAAPVHKNPDYINEMTKEYKERMKHGLPARST